MSDPQLSTGSIERLLTADNGDSSLWEAGHTLQLLSLKKIGPVREGAASDRYRLVVSDGKHYTQAMLATQLSSMVDKGSIGKFTVVNIEKLSCNNVQNKKWVLYKMLLLCTLLTRYLATIRLLILLDLSVVSQTEGKIGDPVAFDVPGQNTTSNTNGTPAVTSPSDIQQPKPPQPQKIQQRVDGPVIYPIEGLSPYQNKWTIRARVAVKSDIRQYSTQKGEGTMFNVTFMDESGEIRATGFNQQVEQFYDKLEEGKVYYVSKARVNLAKKKFSNVQNEYELMFSRDTEITEVCVVSNIYWPY